jgi:hypothetical protein
VTRGPQPGVSVTRTRGVRSLPGFEAPPAETVGYSVSPFVGCCCLGAHRIPMSRRRFRGGQRLVDPGACVCARSSWGEVGAEARGPARCARHFPCFGIWRRAQPRHGWRWMDGMAACANCCTGEGGGDELGLGLLPLEARPGGMNPSISLSRHLNEYLLMTRTSLCRFCFSLPYSVTLTTYFLYQKCICSKHFFKKSIRKNIFF